MKILKSLLPAVLVLVATACATPTEVKAAVKKVDDGYATNAKLMSQYEKLVRSMDERSLLWYRYSEQRNRLNVALTWITGDPVAGEAATVAGGTAEEAAKAKLKMELAVDEVARQLGPDVVKVVNRLRFDQLPARAGPAGSDVFAAGAGSATTSTVIEQMPALVNAIRAQVAKDAAAWEAGFASRDAFKAYASDIAGLRRINQTIGDYLAVDVTVKSADVKELAAAVRKLSAEGE